MRSPVNPPHEGLQFSGTLACKNIYGLKLFGQPVVSVEVVLLETAPPWHVTIYYSIDGDIAKEGFHGLVPTKPSFGMTVTKILKPVLV